MFCVFKSLSRAGLRRHTAFRLLTLGEDQQFVVIQTGQYEPTAIGRGGLGEEVSDGDSHLLDSWVLVIWGGFGSAKLYSFAELLVPRYCIGQIWRNEAVKEFLRHRPVPARF